MEIGYYISNMYHSTKRVTTFDFLVKYHCGIFILNSTYISECHLTLYNSISAVILASIKMPNSFNILLPKSENKF